MTPIDEYGSAKSSGSVSESSASSDSASSDSGSATSTSGSGGVIDSSGSGSDSTSATSGTSDTSTSGSESSGSSGDYCSWEIESITYSADNEMLFVLHNTGTVPIDFTAIWVASDPSMIDTTIAPDVSPSTPSASFTIAAGASQNVAVVSNGDLRAVEFYVDGSCGFKFDTFPVS